MELESSSPHSQEPANCPYSEPDQFRPFLHHASWISILILSFHLHLDLPSGFFPQISPKTFCATLLFSLYVPHVPPVWLLIWSPV